MRKSKIAALAILASLPCYAGAAADFGYLGKPVVVELYTSQGCSSCPPADKFLLELREDENRNILPLSFHVDYWNSLGWADTFSDPSFSERQRNYARHYGSPTIYTPQMVIDGQEFFIGSRKREVNRTIDEFAARNALFASKNIPRLKNCKDSSKRRIIFEGSPKLFQGNDYALYFLTINKRVERVDISKRRKRATSDFVRQCGPGHKGIGLAGSLQRRCRVSSRYRPQCAYRPRASTEGQIRSNSRCR